MLLFEAGRDEVRRRWSSVTRSMPDCVGRVFVWASRLLLAWARPVPIRYLSVPIRRNVEMGHFETRIAQSAMLIVRRLYGRVAEVRRETISCLARLIAPVPFALDFGSRLDRLATDWRGANGFNPSFQNIVAGFKNLELEY